MNVKKKLVFISIIVVVLISGIWATETPTRLSFHRSHIIGFSPTDDWWHESMVDCYSEFGAVDIVFIVDNSGSMESLILEVADEISEFSFDISAIGFDYSFGLVTYCESISFPHGYNLVDDPDEFSDIVRSSTSTGGGTEHHRDALYSAIDDMNWHPGRQHIVVQITDECDDGSSRWSVSNVNSLIDSWDADDTGGDDGTVYFISDDCGDVADFRNYAERSDGIWYPFDSRDMDEVLDQIVDEIADFVEISVTVTNLSGSTIDLLYVELIPEEGIVPGDSSNPRLVGPISSGSAVDIVWDISEIPGVVGYGDCFIISLVNSDSSYTDTIVGCLFVENCGCPGPDAEIICPDISGRWTACPNQYIQVKYTGFVPVNPATICLEVNGLEYCAGDPEMFWDDTMMVFTPPFDWPDGALVNLTVGDAIDVSECAIRFRPVSNFRTDLSPPSIGWWEHHDASIIPPRFAWREWHDGSPDWNPPCGMTVDSTDRISFAGLLFDSLSGLTPIDNLTSISTIDLPSLWSALTSISVTVNGNPFISGLTPGVFTRNIDFDLTYILSGHYVIGGWLVNFSGRADSLSILGGGSEAIEVCINAHDMVEGSYPEYRGCMDCVNDTQWCCTFYLPSTGPHADGGEDQYICHGDSVRIGGAPTASEGTPPYGYRWRPTRSLDSPTNPNPLAFPETTTTYQVTVTDNASKQDSAEVTVFVSNPYADAGNDREICPGDSTTLGGDSTVASNGYPPYQFMWAAPEDPGWYSESERPDVSPEFTCNYILEVTDSLGCLAYDTVMVINDFVPVQSFAPIYPLNGALVPPGTILLQWERAIGENPVIYFVFLDDRLIAGPLDSTSILINANCGENHAWSVEAINLCGYDGFENWQDSLCGDWDSCLADFLGEFGLSGTEIFDSCCPAHPLLFSSTFEGAINPEFSTYACEGPTASIVRPDSNTFTACDPDSIVIFLDDTSEIIDTTILLEVEGVLYNVSDPQLCWREPYLVFKPNPAWISGSIIEVRLLEAMNRNGGVLNEILDWSFIVDLTSPQARLQEPLPETGFVTSNQPIITISVEDLLSGLDSLSLIMRIKDVQYQYRDFHWSSDLERSGGVLTFLPSEAGLSFPPGDTVEICLVASDLPDYCAPNVLDTCWNIMIEPRVECYVHPNPFSPNNDDFNDYIIFDYPRVFSEKADLCIYNLRNIEVFKGTIGPVDNYSQVLQKSWNGMDKNGKLLPEGIYIYTIKVNKETVCNGTIILTR